MRNINESLPDKSLLEYDLRILRSLRRIIRAVDIHSRSLNQKFHITAPQLICLHAIVKNQPLTQIQLAQQVSIGSSTVNGIIDRLEKKGLIFRRRDVTDRRKTFLEPTTAGRDFTQTGPSLLQERFALALKNLPELEQAAITLSLERIVSLMEADHLQASPNLITETNLNTSE